MRELMTRSGQTSKQKGSVSVSYRLPPQLGAYSPVCLLQPQLGAAPALRVTTVIV